MSAFVAALLVARAAAAGDDATEARQKAQVATKAAAAKDWAAAATAWEASLAAQRTPQALEGVARAYDELHADVKAYEAYADLLRSFPEKLSKTSRTTAEDRLRILDARTSELILRINEADAKVTLDDVVLGTTPIAKSPRVPAGLHSIKVAKSGYVDAEQVVKVAGGAPTTVEITLSPRIDRGHLVVREASGESLVLTIDGEERGPLPWEGDIPAGNHEVRARGARAAAPTRGVLVTANGRTEIVLVASPLKSPVEIRTADSKGTIYVDGKPVADGHFQGEIPIGTHTFAIARDGYERYERTVSVSEDQSFREVVALTAVPPRVGADKDSTAKADVLDGTYGGLIPFFSFAAGGSGSQFESPCAVARATDCSQSAPMGGGLLGYVGRMADPLGIDFAFGASGDYASGKLTMGTGTTEQSIARAGGMGALRVRYTLQNSLLRAHLAVGLGGAYRVIAVGDILSANATTYATPAFTVEGAGHLRLGRTTALSLGVMFWVENAGSDARVELNGQQIVVASGPQAILAPYLGLEFGP